MDDAAPPSAQDNPRPSHQPGTPRRPRTPRAGARTWLWLCCLLVGLLGLLPQAVPVLGTTVATERLACLSYAPFRRDGHTPLNPQLKLSDAQLLEDLRLMAQWTGCIRTYGTDHGQDRIPALAGPLGLTVVQGAWISRDPVGSQQEVDRAIALARAHPDTVRLLVLGNEVLLRQERSPQDLAAILRDARQRTTVPVTYADVWEFWLRHAAVLAPEVDVVAAHVLPYWEDVPIGLDQAVAHVLSIHRHLLQAFAGKPVWIAETGWPSAGRQRGPAVPGVREQVQFVRELRAQLHGQGVDYNLIEAFDQPWKRQFEGAMGGAWGVADAQGVLRDPGKGLLPADPLAVGACWGAALGLLMAFFLKALQGLRMGKGGAPRDDDGGAVAVACLGVTMGMLLGAHLTTASIWWRNPTEWAIGLVHAGLALVVCIGCLMRFASLPHQLPTAVVRAWLLVTAWQALTLVFDGRYRPLPALLVAAPAVGLWCTPATVAWCRMGPADRFLAGVLAAAAPVLIVFEGLANTQALTLAMAWLLVAAAVWAAKRDHPGRHDGLDPGGNERASSARS